MSYQKYQDWINGVSGKPVDEEARQKHFEEQGITTEDFSWRGHNNDGSATVYLKDGEPVKVNYYVWNLSQENLQKNLEERFGPIELSDETGGNGHYSASIRRK